MKPKSNFLERGHLRRNRIEKTGRSSETYSQLETTRVLWISTFAGSRSPPPRFSCPREREREREKRAFGYIVPTRSGLSRELCRTWNNDGEQQLVLIPNSVSSMPLHVINAILATCRDAELFDFTRDDFALPSSFPFLPFRIFAPFLHFDRCSRNRGRILFFRCYLSCAWSIFL